MTAQLWAQPDALPEQFTGALPPAPHLQQLSLSWQAMYRALCVGAASLKEDGSASRSVNGLRASSAIRSHDSNDESAALASIQPDDDDDDLEIEDSGVQHVSTYDFETLCQTLSETFNQWLCSSEFGTIERSLRSHLSLQDDIRIILTTCDEAVRRLPWQRWQLLQDFSGAELALSLTQYRRSLRSQNKTRDQPRILAILGDARGIDLEHEQRCLQQLSDCDVKFLTQPSRQQFDQSLWDTTGWDLLFFAGHSSSDSSEKGRLYINEEPQNSLTIDELSEALSAAIENGLQLAIFNSCNGLGLANQLAHLNIPQVIVMREPVPNQVAQHFFQSFLATYVQQGLPLYAATKQSRRQLQALEGDFPGATWLPILCQNPAEKPLMWHELSRRSQKAPAPNPAADSLRISTNVESEIAENKLSRQAYRDRQIFLNKVRSAWIEGVLNKSLPNQILINTGLSEMPLAVQTPAAIAIESVAAANHRLSPEHQLSDYFEQLGIGRSLLLLGFPGAGKTTALLKLAQTLLRRAEDNAKAPMPVVLNLSSWHLNHQKNNTAQQPISQWFQEALYSYYQVPKQQAEAWLRSGQLTLLLDGLDEVAPAILSDCVQAINQFHQDYAQVEIVVCSRQNLYLSVCNATQHHLNLQAALVVEPLSSVQIEDYCSSLGASGENLRLTLESDRQLKEIAASPLMLNILMLSAEDDVPPQQDSHSPNDSPNNNRETNTDSRRTRLLNAYINRMLVRRTRHNNRWSAAATISGLRYLAQQLEQSNQSVFQLEAIQPSWLDRNTRQLGYPLMLGVVLASLLSIVPAMAGLWLGGFWVALSLFFCWGIVGGSISGFVGGWIGGATGGIVGGILSTIVLWLLIPRFSIGLLATPILAILMGLIFGACRDTIAPIESFRWSWQKSLRRLALGIVVGSFLGLPLWLTGSVEWRVVIPAIALFFSLLGGFTKRSRIDANFTRPNEGIWRTGANALRLGLTIAVIYGLFTTLIFGLNTGGSRESFQASLPFGVIAGLLIGVFTGLASAEGSGVVYIQHWVLRFLLSQQKRIPWNYAQFLNDCADRILLKKVGGNYIFVHRLLQEHFANWRPDA